MEYDNQARKAKDREEMIAQELIQEHQYLAGERGNFDSHWNEIAERIDPLDTKQFNSISQNEFSQGDKRTQEIYDSTAATALDRFPAILDSLLTPVNQTWHRLRASDPELNKDHEVKLWFEQLNRALFEYRYAASANFAGQNQQVYRSLGAYGTGCLFIDAMADQYGLRYKNVHLSQLYFAENHQGIVDKVLRYFSMTARQAVQKWGKEKMPSAIVQAMEKTPERIFWFIHCVKPNADYKHTRLDYRGMKWSSFYVSVEGKKLMDEGGYTTFPYAISRYMQANNEVYGRSPAMSVLPAMKTLNEEKKAVLKQGHRALDPIILAADDGVADAFSWKPGTVVSGGVDAQGRPLLQTLQTGSIVAGKELMDDERMVIKDAFLTTVFQLLTESPQMTATEVMERTREKGILLAPIGRQNSEYLGPMIDREIDVLSRQGLLAPMPDILREAKGSYKIEYDSPISRSQRAEEVAGVMRSIESSMNVAAATQDPSKLDYYNFDVIIPAVSEIQGVPASWMNSKKDIEAIRAGRAQQAQQAALVQAAPAAAAMMKAGAAVKKSGGV